MKICRGHFIPVSVKYSSDLRLLISQLFRTSPRDRPSINSIFKKAFLEKQIKNYLPPEVSIFCGWELLGPFKTPLSVDGIFLPLLMWKKALFIIKHPSPYIWRAVSILTLQKTVKNNPCSKHWARTLVEPKLDVVVLWICYGDLVIVGWLF